MSSREKILDVSLELFYRNGYQATSVDDIIALAKVSKSNFYYHFKSKEDLGLLVLNQRREDLMRSLDCMLGDCDECPKERLLRFVDHLVDTQEAELKKGGYTIAQKTEINIVGQDTAAQLRDAQASVATMKAAGVDTVVVVVPFTVNSSFFDEAKNSNAGFQYMLIDAASSLCTQFGASRVPAAIGSSSVPCVTTWDTRAVNAKNAIKKDNAFEAKCRVTMDAALNEKTQPGVPAGDVTDAAGVTLTEDVAPNECTMVDLFMQALKKAGKNPTTDKLYDGFLTIKKNPAAYQSNGEGGFSKTKTYFSNSVHLEILNLASTQTPKDANGLYNGCPAPVNCWVPQLIGGSEWFPVTPAT